LIRKAANFAATGFIIATIIFGVTVGMYAFYETYTGWGAAGIAVGLFVFFGAGLIPIGIICAFFTAGWPEAAGLTVLTALCFAAFCMFTWARQRAADHRLVIEAGHASTQLRGHASGAKLFGSP
jgi:hypothetical protein